MTRKPSYCYNDLKQLARDLDRPVSTLIALAPANDPFYVTPARQTAAAWFARIWGKLRIGPGAHIRRIHYVLISQKKSVLTSDGMPFENTEACWQSLLAASKDARYLAMVPITDFVDRRNAEAILNFRETRQSASYVNGSDINDLPDDMPEPPSIRLIEGAPAQRFQIEIWAEKTTVNDILIPLAERYGAHLVTGAGELSATACSLCVERAKQDGRPVRILYVSDFDPAGQSMPVAVARKIEFLVRDGNLDLDIQVRPVLLTAQQCERYALPRTPIKETELRAGAFEARYGTGATELDALEALHPGELARILQREIHRYYDATLARRTAATAAMVRTTLANFNDSIHERFADEIETVRGEYEDVVAAHRQWLERAEAQWHAIEETLRAEAPDMSAIEWPQPVDGDEDPDPLFDGYRDYLAQIDAYKHFQDKPTARRPKESKPLAKKPTARQPKKRGRK